MPRHAVVAAAASLSLLDDVSVTPPCRVCFMLPPFDAAAYRRLMPLMIRHFSICRHKAMDEYAVAAGENTNNGTDRRLAALTLPRHMIRLSPCRRHAAADMFQMRRRHGGAIDEHDDGHAPRL